MGSKNDSDFEGFFVGCMSLVLVFAFSALLMMAKCQKVERCIDQGGNPVLCQFEK